MISTKLASIGLAASLVAVLPAVSAQAQAPRTFVSAAGSDSNPCSFAAPCRHFQAAVNATSAGGEVDALDPAGYGPIIISQAVTIEGQGWSYIAPPNNGIAITINAASGKVAIHGVSLNGAGITGNTNGIVQFRPQLKRSGQRDPKFHRFWYLVHSELFDAEPDFCVEHANFR